MLNELVKDVYISLNDNDITILKDKIEGIAVKLNRNALRFRKNLDFNGILLLFTINPNEANLYFSGAFNDNSYPTIDIEDSTLYAIYESREERPDRTIISRSEVIELFKFGSENALLTLGEMTEFTSPEDETKKLFIEVEKDEYYMLDLYDNANSELSGEVLVLSSEPYSMKYELNQPKELARLSGV